MDLNVTVGTNELFENNDMVFPILMGRENLKVSLASPGSESSGVSSLDAEEAKKMANDQLTTSSSSPESASESNSPEQTESESSDENNENEQSSDDETSTTASNGKSNGTIDEQQQQRSPESIAAANVDETKTIETNIGTATDNYEKNSEDQNEQELPLDACDTMNMVDEIIDDVTATTQDISTLSEDDSDDIRYKSLRLIYGGRDILDLANNLNQSCNIQYTHLPDYNIPMYMSNRSQYHRLGSSWETHELKYGMCRRCGFRVPEDPPMAGGPVAKSSSMVSESLCNLSHIAAITAPIGNNANHNNNNNHNNNHSTLMQNMTISSALTRISPVNSTLNPATPKFQPSTTPLPASGGQMFNFNMNNNNNNSNNPSNNQQLFGYQNQMSAPNNNNNNMSAVYKQQQQQQQQQQHQQQQQNSSSNGFYGNMTLNSMISQLAMDTNNSAFNPNQYLNGAGNGTNYTSNNINQLANNLNTSAAIINQLMNQNRHNQGGMCRPLANKSGINLNANSHNKMPAYKMYSHF